VGYGCTEAANTPPVALIEFGATRSKSGVHSDALILRFMEAGRDGFRLPLIVFAIPLVRDKSASETSGPNTKPVTVPSVAGSYCIANAVSIPEKPTLPLMIAPPVQVLEPGVVVPSIGSNGGPSGITTCIHPAPAVVSSDVRLKLTVVVVLLGAGAIADTA